MSAQVSDQIPTDDNDINFVSMCRGWYVRIEREKSSCDTRGLRDGCGQDYAEGLREEYEHKEIVQIITLSLWSILVF